MLPVTHYLYLGLGLFCVGLCGAALRRSLVVALLGIQLMLAGAALCLCAYGRSFLDPGAQVMASLVMLVGLCELAIAAAVIVRSLRYDASGEQPEPELGHERGTGLLDDWTLGGPS